jgi:signal peptidase II
MSRLHVQRRELVLASIAALVIVVDQLVKAAVMRYLPPETPWNPISWLRPIVTLNYITNTGAAFGLFPQFGNILVFVALGVVLALVVFFRRLPSAHWLLPVCLGMQLGGALGNLVDRLRFGHVIDFVDFHWWPVFNVADSCIVVGVLILAVLLLRDAPQEQAQQAGPDAH